MKHPGRLEPTAYAIIMLLLFFGACTSPKETSWTLYAPENNIYITLTLNAESTDHSLSYSVSALKNDTVYQVVLPSPLGLEIADFDLSQLSYRSKSEIIKNNNTYPVIHGKHNQLVDQFQEQSILFANPAGNELTITLRAYNDGVAFRYSINQSDTKAYVVNRELSGFHIPQGKAWMQPYDKITKWTPAYELPFENGITVGTTSPNIEGWAFPMLFETAHQWILISESGLNETYAGSHAEAVAVDGLYKLKFPEQAEAEGLGSANPSIQLPWQSPWRAIIIGSSLADIVASDMIVRLAPAPKNQNLEWIKPGVASWSWWSDHDSPQSPEKLKTFIDLAAEMNWPYTLIDANWNKIPEEKFKAVIDYALSKNIAPWLWYNSGGPHNVVEEAPRDRMLDRETRRKEFEKLHALGIAGVKIDFFQSDKQQVIKQYLEILQDAADFQILINFHGCTIPRGWDRTYPHQLSMESVRGAESYSFDKAYPAYAPAQNTIIPFTRNVLGPMDYTPVTFTNQEYPHITTLAHELALSIVFESGIQHFADRVSAYRQLPADVKNFLKNVPVTWDETKLLSGYPGKDVVIARKKGTTWYIAGINGEGSSKEIMVDLSQLNLSSQNWKLITDATDSLQTTAVQDTQTLKISLKPYGGFVATIN
jgi:alpha-glucosidase